jgi:hypothetical protein
MSIKYPLTSETGILTNLLNFETCSEPNRQKSLPNLVLRKMIDVTGLLSNGNLLANGCGPTHKPTNISIVREANCLKVEHRILILNTRTEYIAYP